MRALPLTFAAAVAAFACAFPLHAQNSTNPNANEGVGTFPIPVPGAASDVWRQEADGSVVHVQSGLACPATFPGVTLWHVFIYPSPARRGMDVGCDYGRAPSSNTGEWETKLTIYAVRTEQGTTLENAFERYRDEVHTVYPEARTTGPAIAARPDESGAVALPEFRSEADDITFNGHPFHSELVVAIVSGWVVEVRSTYPPPSPDAGASPDAGNSLGALIQAASSIGRSI
jgi:hypothetical protein